MPTFEPLDPGFPVARQVDIDAGPIVMINLCTMAPADEDAFLAAWAEDARFMKLQPGLISTQLHRAIGDNPTYFNYAVFESVVAWRDAFNHPEFRERLKAHPPSVTARPHLFEKVAVPGLCTA
ncbi:antibiotic biosynthesis monooxygenase family protein [Ralstonia pseudosolanacearum]|uniref:antibiotic biosynthesis monooxygenase family protein n=1 Tax=Ralstonia solanacearum species complex TaxID=3116862 RepID=UPI0002D3E70A|nr:antibiotic biosynthesis monooxygenase family protein [Ralstonia pseudosolanacearum]MCK4122014.1 antibiotic biosynthesis monooxygenase [Ralstonia pseudosolanacearum]MCK4151351.1 antibiotic biosynthesis monooxygenase [Ralstonia pseudosolanacearum]QIK20674.1 antibiotic biosynthesis monooxygenase [Ralstonia solanacearum]